MSQRRGKDRVDGGRSGRMTAQCFGRRCRKFVCSPSTPCSYCGNDPVPFPNVGVSERHWRDKFDDEHGWDPYEKYRNL